MSWLFACFLLLQQRIKVKLKQEEDEGWLQMGGPSEHKKQAHKLDGKTTMLVRQKLLLHMEGLRLWFIAWFPYLFQDYTISMLISAVLFQSFKDKDQP